MAAMAEWDILIEDDELQDMESRAAELLDIRERLCDAEYAHPDPLPNAVTPEVISTVRQLTLEERLSCCVKITPKAFAERNLLAEDEHDEDYDPALSAESSQEDPSGSGTEAESAAEAELTGRPTTCAKNCLAQIPDRDLIPLYTGYSQLTQKERKRECTGLILSTATCVLPRETDGDAEEEGPAPKAPKLQRARQGYYILGAKLCRDCLLSVTRLGRFQLRAIKDKFAQQRFMAADDGRNGARASNDNGQVNHRRKTAEVVTFLSNFSEQHGYTGVAKHCRSAHPRCSHPDPTGRKSQKDQPSVLLPVVWLKRRVHEVYETNYPSALGQAVSYSYFLRVWKEHVKWLSVMGQRTDMCNTCHDLSAHKFYDLLEAHMLDATKSREFKNAQIKKCFDSCKLLNEQWLLHVSFDFAEYIQLPLFTDQVCVD
jgi:hypothetical protein